MNEKGTRYWHKLAEEALLGDRFEEAMQYESKALAFAIKTATVHQYEVHAAHARLAAMSMATGDYVNAEKHYLACLRFRELTLESTDIRLRPILADLGLICYRLQKLEEAEAYFRRALALKAESDSESPGLLHGLGMTLCGQNRNEQAQPFCRHADLLLCENKTFSEARLDCEATLANRERIGSDLRSRLSSYLHYVRRLNCCDTAQEIESFLLSA